MARLFDSELKVMEALWHRGELSAGQLAKVLGEEIGWNRNTTYTVVKKCVEKGAVKRSEPGFICTPLVTREQIRHQEIDLLIRRMFGGSKELFFSAFLQGERWTAQEIEKLKEMVEELGK